MKYDAILNKSYGLFCKDYYLYDERKIKDISNEELKEIFPFWENPNNKDRQFKHSKIKDFPLLWRKENQQFKIDKNKIVNISNIDDLKNYIKLLLPNSFGIEVKFKLKAPYFSRDDDEFYIIQNPCLKEKIFKVPMVRGSSWKGVLANAFKDLINEENSNQREKINSFLRIFGAGSESIKAIENYLKTKQGRIKDNLLEFMLFELGIKIEKNILEEIKNIDNNSLNDFLNKFFNKQLLKTKKGRAIFYPTYFDRLSLEIINPHNRKTKAGTNPIHYEVVPKGSEGIFQLVYIPFDVILEDDEKIKKEAKQDLKFLQECIKIAFENGIGAKTKLGWGRAVIKDEDIKVFWSER